MNWRDIVALAGHGGEQVFCIVEAHAAPRQARERATAGRQQIQRHPNQRIVIAEVRERKLPDDQAARRFQHQRLRHRAVRHIGTLKSS
jgi:hypothetical protein